jgi:hypothetical protein
MCSKGSVRLSRAINRRDFLRLSGVGLSGAALLGIAGLIEGAAQEGSPNTSLVAEFEEAATTYDVPVELLLAIGYVNTRWEMPHPEASDYDPGSPHGRGAYGIMQLVRNASEDTLSEASRLTGIPEDALKTDRGANILGGAALLAESEGERPLSLGDYFGAVAGRGKGRFIKAVAGIGAGDRFAGQVFATLSRGVSGTTPEGEQISLPSQEGRL